MAKDSTETIEKITPSPSELIMSTWQEKLPVKCSEPGCTHVAANSSVMNLHKAKVHKIMSGRKEGVVKQFYCPITLCNFSAESGRCFKSIDTLRVHYMKVHFEKNFKCSKCGKAFALDRDCQRHEEECGQTFSCPQCGKVYTKKDSLLKHCDVKDHTRPVFTPKPKPVKKLKVCEVKVKKADTKNDKEKKGPAFILPKQPSQVFVPVPVPPQSSELQTDSTGVQFLISKLAQPVSQGVHTASQTLNNEAKTVGIQTPLELQRASALAYRSPCKKMSMGIQAVLLVPPLSAVQPCVAQTQTLESTSQPCARSQLTPVLKKNKGSQKSPKKTKKRKNVVKSSSGCQTNFSPRSKRPNLSQKSTQRSTSAVGGRTLLPPLKRGLWNTDILSPPSSCSGSTKPQTEQDQEEFDVSMEDFLNSMSTQTELSCLLEHLLPPSSPQLPLTPTFQFHNSHTQTSQANHFNLPFGGAPEQSIMTQTDSQNSGLSYDRKAYGYRGNIIQSSHTQTSLGEDHLLSRVHHHKHSKQTQYCFSETDISLQDQNIQTQSDLQDFILEYQEQTTQTQNEGFQTSHTQTPLINYFLPSLTEYQEQNTQTHNNCSHRSVGVSSHLHDFPLLSMGYQEQNTQTQILPSRDSTTQTRLGNFSNRDNRHYATQTSFSGGFTTLLDSSIACDKPVFTSEFQTCMTEPSMTSTCSQTPASLINQTDNTYGTDSALDLLLQLTDKTADEVKSESKSTEPLDNFVSKPSDNTCQTDSSFVAQSQGSNLFNNVSDMIPHITGFNDDNSASANLELAAHKSVQSMASPLLGPVTSEVATLTQPYDCGWEMGTQTVNDFAWDTGTQTMDTLSWDTDTQAIEDFVLEMGTQTMADMSWEMACDAEDELSLEMGTQTLEEFITDSHTQTDEAAVAHAGNGQLQSLSKEIETQTTETSSGHQRAAQTEADWLEYLTKEIETQTTEASRPFFSGNQQAAQTEEDWFKYLTKESETQTTDPFNALSSHNQREVQTGDDLLEFFTRESETQTLEAFSIFSAHDQRGVQTGDDLLEFLTRESHTQTMDLPDVGNAASRPISCGNRVQSTDCIFMSPLLSTNVVMPNTLSASAGKSATLRKHTETSETQTNPDLLFGELESVRQSTLEQSSLTKGADQSLHSSTHAIADMVIGGIRALAEDRREQHKQTIFQSRKDQSTSPLKLKQTSGTQKH